MAENTRKLLQKFYVEFRQSLNAAEIHRAVSGLSSFDIEQIETRLRNEGNTLAVDRLVDIVGRKSTRTFVNFVDALRKYGHEELHQKIMFEAKQNHADIYRVLFVPPVATVEPVRSNNTVPVNTTNTQQTEFEQSMGARQLSIHGTITTVPNQSPETDSLTLDTDLNSIGYDFIDQWITELNKDGQWKKMASTMKLKYQKVKELGKCSNPAEQLFDDHCCDLTIRDFVAYLNDAKLTTVLDMVIAQLNYTELTDSSDIPKQHPQPNGDNLPLNVPVVPDSNNVPRKQSQAGRQNELSNTDASITDNAGFEYHQDQKPRNTGKVTSTANEASFNVAAVKTMTVNNVYTTYVSSTEKNNHDLVMQKHLNVDDEEGSIKFSADDKGICFSIEENDNIISLDNSQPPSDVTNESYTYGRILYDRYK